MEIKRAHEGNIALLEMNEDDSFKRIYISFDACKRRFLAGCRRVVGLDGAFLKGVVKGEVLTAVGRDGNNQMFPIALGVMNMENKDNWKWFIQILQMDISIGRGAGWTFVSDQCKVCIHLFNLFKFNAILLSHLLSLVY